MRVSMTNKKTAKHRHTVWSNREGLAKRSNALESRGSKLIAVTTLITALLKCTNPQRRSVLGIVRSQEHQKITKNQGKHRCTSNANAKSNFPGLLAEPQT